MRQAEQGARVLIGFEPSLGAARDLLTRARGVGVLLPATLADEFALVMTEDYGALVQRGGSARILMAGQPSTDVRLMLRERGVEVRALDEGREVGMMVSDQGALLFPFGQEADSPLTVVALLVTDPIATAHFQLAFEAAWERAEGR